jgi:hypothetical protein
MEGMHGLNRSANFALELTRSEKFTDILDQYVLVGFMANGYRFMTKFSNFRVFEQSEFNV